VHAAIWNNIAIYIIIFWSLFWKGVALWRAAQLKQRNWFVVILVLNSITLGLLELVYLFRFAKKRLTFDEIKTWKNFFASRETEKK
jgi:hypothetical protein